MKIRIAPLLIAATAALGSVSAYASKPMSGTPVHCFDSVALTADAGYVTCQGPTSGNISPGQVDTATFAGYGTFDLVGSTNDLNAGPFAADPGGVTSGVLTFDTTMYGPFVIGIKGGPDYSLYLFDAGNTGITSLNFDTLGIVNGDGRPGPGLSHASLFLMPVPEPETWALMLAGLAAVGFMSRRRKA